MDYIALKLTKRDGVPVVKLQCPKCEVWGDIDQDQIEGKISLLCECGFHETENIIKKLKDAAC